MKLRIHQNSVRLRLSRGEVAHLQSTGKIENALDVGSMGTFTYSICVVEQFTVNCIYDRSGLHVKVPRHLAQAWMSGDGVDISAEQRLDGDKTLQIIIEKDFQCLHKPDEADSDAFPNPAQKHHLSN